MKIRKCIGCGEEKSTRLFNSNHIYRCTECHDKFVAENKNAINKAQQDRIEAHISGEMPRPKGKKPAYNNDTRRKIDAILEGMNDKKRLESYE